jgi:hypothetical protein
MADDNPTAGSDSAAPKPGKPTKAAKKKAKRKRGKARAKTSNPSAAARFERRPYPRATLEDALTVAYALKDKNGGNPWSPDELANALGVAKSNNRFFYNTASARDFGLTSGSRDTDQIALTDLGRELVYAPSPQTEDAAKRKAFLGVDVFKRVLEYYKGSNLPEMKYLSNTLQNQFGLDPRTHEEFSDLFKRNCDYLKIGTGFSTATPTPGSSSAIATPSKDVITLAEPEQGTGLTCFVVMPFRERDTAHAPGFFDEVLQGLIAPAGRKAGFTVNTANRQGTEVIHSSIINDLLNADLVIADLTEHNPNVMFELGLRMAADKPVAIIRARGTGPVFDVDNMLRVYDYDPNLWPSTVERDLPKLIGHIQATWNNRENDRTYMKILRSGG